MNSKSGARDLIANRMNAIAAGFRAPAPRLCRGFYEFAVEHSRTFEVALHSD
jgi:hypothetical protein